MRTRIDLTGQVFGDLTVTHHVERRKWACLCSCGATAKVAIDKLRSGHTTSCGHKRVDILKARSTSHGQAKRGATSPEYRVWRSAIGRCTNPTNAAWGRYGGRGITVCPEWATFEQFYADMGPRPEGTSLDRIDNDRGYAPDNCRWATSKEQQNNRRSNVHVTIDGVTRTLKQWAEHFGISYAVVKERRADGKDGVDLFLASPRRSYKRLISFDGKQLTVTAWAKLLNAPYITVWQRLNLANKNPDGSTKE